MQTLKKLFIQALIISAIIPNKNIVRGVITKIQSI